eukprot:TRINITY_DN17413_c0_g1_i1.p1 TRINITY_DN17413_c0_g1~~TRINITY_DN17413_c0_g1_i1.p1  ORF type:complete len:337 (+),score=44.41 TRINITY_DN17413_c0_g1_i1:68-1078(+)
MGNAIRASGWSKRDDSKAEAAVNCGVVPAPAPTAEPRTPSAPSSAPPAAPCIPGSADDEQSEGAARCEDEEAIPNSVSFVPEMTFKMKPEGHRVPQGRAGGAADDLESRHSEVSDDDCSQSGDEHPMTGRTSTQNSLLSLVSWPLVLKAPHRPRPSSSSTSDAGETQLFTKRRQPPVSPLSDPGGRQKKGFLFGTTSSPKSAGEARARRPSVDSGSSLDSEKNRNKISIVAAANLKKETHSDGKASQSQSQARRMSFQKVDDINSMDRGALTKRRASVQSEMGAISFNKSARAKRRSVQDLWDIDHDDSVEKVNSRPRGGSTPKRADRGDSGGGDS